MSESLYALAEQVGKTLVAHDQKLVTAESCTGGWVAQSITDIPGSSAWFDRGFCYLQQRSQARYAGCQSENH